MKNVIKKAVEERGVSRHRQETKTGEEARLKVVESPGLLHLRVAKQASKNLQETKKAAEAAEGAPIDPYELNVDEDLFDIEDDEDWDDLDFDDHETKKHLIIKVSRFV